MEQYARFNSEGLLEQTCAKTDSDKEKLLAEGFLPYEVDCEPAVLEEFQGLEPKHRNDGDKIITYFEVVDNDPTLIQQKIDTLKTQLQDMDYLDHKEADGEDMVKYGDWRATRRALRQQIRELQLKQ